MKHPFARTAALLLALALVLTACGAPAAPPAAPASPESQPESSSLPAESSAPQSAPPESASDSSSESASESAPESSEPSSAPESLPEEAYVDKVKLPENAAVMPLTDTPAVSTVLLPVASGTAVESGGGAEIDYSNVTDGYVMVRYPGSSASRLKVQVVGPSTTYTYNLTPGIWTTFPLSDGNGGYMVRALQNVEGKKYAVLVAANFSVSLQDEFAPFLRPNQYVNYAGAANTIQKAAEICGGHPEPLDKVQQIYNFVVGNLTYDQQKAASVQSGYLPDLDTVLATKTGICFDYAALMTGMLRSQNVPTKLVVGYAGTAYHAWVSVWTEETGWVDGVIFFDGTTWQRMDPTFASSGGGDPAIQQYIGDGSNYTVKYLY